MSIPTTLIFICICMVSWSKLTPEMAYQVLGFEEWEEPSSEEIKAQFNLLTDEFNQGIQDQQAKDKYQEVKRAFDFLKNHNFGGNDQRRSENQQSTNTYRRRQGGNRGHSGFENGFFSQGNNHRTFTTIHLDQILNNIDFTFSSMNNETDQISITFNFTDFLLQNPIILVAAFLISVGIINLCTCCCCCCCCAKNQNQRQASRDQKDNELLTNVSKLWLEKIMKKKQ